MSIDLNSYGQVEEVGRLVLDGLAKVSNREFLETMVPVLPEGACIPVASNNDLSNWTPKSWAHGQELVIREGWNGYCCLASHRRGNPQPRTKESFLALHWVMLDDIGPKVPRDQIRLAPTCEIETSSGNSQFLYRLKIPVTDLDLVDRIGRAITRAKLSDPGAGGLATRYGRLPQCSNTKYDPQFECRPRSFNPELSYTVQELVDGLGLELDPPQDERKPEPKAQQARPSQDDQLIIEKASCAANGAKFDALMRGDLSEHGDDHSAADMALCSMLAFWTRVPEQIDRIFRTSGLMRDKWDERHGRDTYGNITIQKALELVPEAGESDWPHNGGQTAPLSPWPDFIDFDEQPPDLPVGILPGILGEFSEGLAHATQTPRELAAVNVLGVVALAVQHKLIVRVKPDYCEGLNLFAIVASEPGERKSAVVSACKAPLVEWEIAQEARSLDEIRDTLSKRRTMEKAVEKARTKAASAKTAEERRQAAEEICQMERELPEVPTLPRLLVDDVTPEALAPIMAGSGESIGMLEAEGGALDTLSGRYSNGVPNIDLFLKAFGAESHIVDRKGKEPIRLRKPRLTMILTPQPSVLRAAGSNEVFMGRGLVARCLLVLPRPLVGFRDNAQTIPPDLTRKWTAYVNGLLAIPGQVVPHELTLSPEAFALWLDFSNDVEVAQRPGGEFEFMRAWASKLTGLVVRLAGILHMAQGLPAIHMPIGLDTMRNAVMLATWAAEHAKHAYSCFGLDDGLEAAKRALEWIRKERRESVTAREILRALRGRFPTMEKIRPGLDVLVDRGALVPRDNGRPSSKGGRPSETYGVNPAVYEVPTC